MLKNYFSQRWQMLAFQSIIILASLIIAKFIASGNIMIIFLVLFMTTFMLAVYFNKIYQFILISVMYYLFLLPWETIRTHEIWSLPTRGILGYRVGEHVLIFAMLFFCIILAKITTERINKDKRIEFPMLGGFVIYILLGIVSSLLAYDTVESFSGVISRKIIPGMLIFYITYYCICKTDFLKIPQILVMIGLICSVYGIYEFVTATNPISDFYAVFYKPEQLAPSLQTKLMGITKAYRITSTFGNPEFASSVFGVVSIISLSMFLLGRSPRILYFGSFVINAIGLLLTFTRGGMISYIVALTLFIIYGKRQLGGFKNVILICLAIMAVSAVVLYVEDYLIYRFLYSDITGFTHRINAYSIFANVIIAHPIFGIGLGSMNYLHAHNYFASNIATFTDTFDNSYIGLISQMGLLILIPMFIFAKKIRSSIRYALNSDTNSNYILRLGTVASLLFICLSFIFYDGFTYLVTNGLFWILVAMLFSFARDNKSLSRF